MVEAIHIIKTEKEYAKGSFKKNLGVADPEGLERAYKDYSNVFPKFPIQPPTASRPCSMTWRRKIPKAASADPKTFVDHELGRGVGEVGVY